MLVLIKGAGDLASGVACRLHRAGIRLVMTDIPKPTVIRRQVAFAQAVYDGEAKVENIKGVLVKDALAAMITIEQGHIPILVDPDCKIAKELKFDGLVDGILAKQNLGTTIEDAPIVIALGPGFEAGRDCHGVVETKRGHDLARVITTGGAVPNTGVPGMIGGVALERLIKAPAAGCFITKKEIGDVVKIGQLLGEIQNKDGQVTPVNAAIDGVLRGILQNGLIVPQGMKIGDIDPRGVVESCFTVSDKARAIGGGVLEAILYFAVQKNPNLYQSIF